MSAGLPKTITLLSNSYLADSNRFTPGSKPTSGLTQALSTNSHTTRTKPLRFLSYQDDITRGSRVVHVLSRDLSLAGGGVGLGGWLRSTCPRWVRKGFHGIIISRKFGTVTTGMFLTCAFKRRLRSSVRRTTLRLMVNGWSAKKWKEWNSVSENIVQITTLPSPSCNYNSNTITAFIIITIIIITITTTIIIIIITTIIIITIITTTIVITIIIIITIIITITITTIITTITNINNLSWDKTLFTYNTRLRPKYGRYLSDDFKMFRPLFKTKFAYWLSLMIIQSFKWRSRKKQVLDFKKTAPVYVIFPVMLQRAGFYLESH